MALHEDIKRAVRQYLVDLDDNAPTPMHALFIGETERALLGVLHEYTNGNQTKMAKMLGISRGNLRTKLQQYEI